MARVLLAGESWINAVTDYKGFDAFPHTRLEIGCERLVQALTAAGHDVVHMPSHAVATDFPETEEKLAAYDVVLLSDVGANTLLLPPVVFNQGRPFPNRLKVLAQWVRNGGGLMMAGGYLSFQGFQAKANYHGTAVEDVLPVSILPYDDRVETPEGIGGELTAERHPVTAGLDDRWPILLGYQRLTAKDDATVLATVEGRPLLAVRTEGAGRTLAFASDISPHWAPREFLDWDGYQRLFDQAVTWLADSSAPAGRD
ncbi:cytoplasmic protein [Streptomyces kasugaensis]|uniref:Cytoplasmic protein n=1 Tax=Streptomyces kasugaensis TaxID=1946 RepID=A0A4Q9HSK7_STRKA|nr:glutamine amidotransferase [Streptomyces kasugaensis]TBO57459.1 cytoplasmic protein [Streptomyces kasugaensis]